MSALVGPPSGGLPRPAESGPATAARYIARATDIAARRIGDEMMIMSGRDSSLISLNATATALWQAADGTTPLADIVARCICAEFAVDAEVALRDAEELALGLARHGVLRVSDTPIADAGAGDAP